MDPAHVPLCRADRELCRNDENGDVDNTDVISPIDREFVTSAKKFVNFNEFSKIKKNRKNSYKNSLNAWG